MSEQNYQSTLQTPIGEITILGNDNAIQVITFNVLKKEDLNPNKLTELAASELSDYFKGSIQKFTFPISQEGTAFQKDVWGRLLDIPYGTTTSYAQFSAHHPLAIRAIAAANGKNNIAIVVPCHRVIGSSGKLVGYAGGLERKRWLLEHETKITGKGQACLPF